MQMISDTTKRWRKSTRSEGKDACVEVAFGAFGVAVRDSKNPDVGHHSFSPTAWRSFLDAAPVLKSTTS
jgi:hypothetical protein